MVWVGSDNMKTVLHIITGLNDGGAEAVLYRLCVYDQNNRHHVISLIDGGKYGPMLEARGVSVTCLNMPRGRLTFKGLRTLRAELRDKKPDVVQTWMYHADFLGGIIAKLTSNVRVYWGIRHTTLDATKSSRGTIWIAKLCTILSYIVPTKIICCAKKSREIHTELGYAKDKMCVISNGYDFSVFKPSRSLGKATRVTLGLEAEGLIIGCVARFNAQKDHANLLAALAILRQRGIAPICLLVGVGLEQGNTELVTMIESFNLDSQIRLLGTRNDIPDIMNALDLHVLSSAFGEAFPNVLAEAMACGTPCVTTDVGDASVIVGEAGWIVPPSDPEKLANMIATALEAVRGPERSSLRKAARAHVVGNFSIENMVAAYHANWFGSDIDRHENGGGIDQARCQSQNPNGDQA